MMMVVSLVMLPHSSNASYVLLMATPMPQGFEMVTSQNLIEGFPQLSIASTSLSVGSPMQTRSRRPINTGGSLSTSWAVIDNELSLPHSSTAFHVNVCCSIKPKNSQLAVLIISLSKEIVEDPQDGNPMTEETFKESKKTGIPPSLHVNVKTESPATLINAGCMICMAGPWSSRRVIRCEMFVSFPQRSVAFQVLTITCPSWQPSAM